MIHAPSTDINTDPRPWPCPTSLWSRHSGASRSMPTYDVLEKILTATGPKALAAALVLRRTAAGQQQRRFLYEVLRFERAAEVASVHGNPPPGWDPVQKPADDEL